MYYVYIGADGLPEATGEAAPWKIPLYETPVFVDAVREAEKLRESWKAPGRAEPEGS